MVSERDKIIWAAGFFDGEGCIYCDKPDMSCLGNLRLSIGQVDPEPLKLFKRIFGGSLTKEKSRNVYRWRFQSYENVKKTLEKLQPYLVVKKKECDFLLKHISAFEPIKRGKNGGNSKIFNARLRIHKKLKEIKDLKYDRKSK